MLKELFSKKYYRKNKNKPYFEKRNPKKISLISPIQYKKNDKIKDKILFKGIKSNFEKYKNLGLEIIIPNSHKRNYFKNNIIYPYFSSKNSTKTNSSNIFFTTANTTSNNERNDKINFYSFDEGKILYKKKINLQNDIISLKIQKYNLLKENKELFEYENKIKLLNNEVDKMNMIIINYKKDYNELNSQCLNLKKKIELIYKKDKDEE